MGPHHCRHYRYETGPGMRGPFCAIGIDLHATGGWHACMSPPHDPCPKREEWADEERAAASTWRDAMMARFAAAVDALPRAVECGERVEIKCPNCADGMVVVDRWSNGHALVECTTLNCVGLIESDIGPETKWPAHGVFCVETRGDA